MPTAGPWLLKQQSAVELRRQPGAALASLGAEYDLVEEASRQRQHSPISIPSNQVTSVDFFEPWRPFVPAAWLASRQSCRNNLRQLATDFLKL